MFEYLSLLALAQDMDPETPEAEALDDKLDVAWYALTSKEMALLNALSVGSAARAELAELRAELARLHGAQKETKT